MRSETVDQIATRAGASAVAVSLYDWETATAWSLRGERWFHAASTIKLAILLALADAVGAGRFGWDDRLHVRNRFASRVDAEPFRVERERDADAAVHGEVGRTMPLRDLAERMIVASSNLATNLLLDLVGVQETRQTLARLGLAGIEVVRGVEDHRAFAAGINNRVTADGLLALLRLLHEPRDLGAEGAAMMLEILARQELGGAIRRGLPEAARARARVANKTGEIAGVAHDAGLVLLPERRPFALVVLSEWQEGTAGRQAALGAVVGALYDHFVSPGTVREDAT